MMQTPPGVPLSRVPAYCLSTQQGDPPFGVIDRAYSRGGALDRVYTQSQLLWMHRVVIVPRIPYDGCPHPDLLYSTVYTVYQTRKPMPSLLAFGSYLTLTSITGHT